MTGFASVSGAAAGGLAWTLTLKSVNHRFFDLHTRMPAGAEPLELRMRKLLKERIKRGHLDLTLSLGRAGGAVAALDHALLKGYIETFRAATAEHNLDQQPDLNAILRLPGVLGGPGGADEEEMGAVEGEVMARAESLIEALKTMRSEEGHALAAELALAMGRLKAAVTEVAELRNNAQTENYQRLRERLVSLLEGSGDGALYHDRILQEAALLAERSDIEEETARLLAHIGHFLSLLETGGEIGKKLDFLLQEMNREANTLLSKAGGVPGGGRRITELGLAMRSEIEKAREQAQNIE